MSTYTAAVPLRALLSGYTNTHARQFARRLTKAASNASSWQTWPVTVSPLLAEPLQSHQALKHAFDHRHTVPDIRSHMVRAVVSVHMATGDGRGGDMKVKGRKVSYALRSRERAKHNFASHEPESFSCTRPAARPLYMCQRRSQLSSLRSLPAQPAAATPRAPPGGCRGPSVRRTQARSNQRRGESGLTSMRGPARGSAVTAKRRTSCRLGRRTTPKPRDHNGGGQP